MSAHDTCNVLASAPGPKFKLSAVILGTAVITMFVIINFSGAAIAFLHLIVTISVKTTTIEVPKVLCISNCSDLQWL